MFSMSSKSYVIDIKSLHADDMLRECIHTSRLNSSATPTCKMRKMLRQKLHGIWTATVE